MTRSSEASAGTEASENRIDGEAGANAENHDTTIVAVPSRTKACLITMLAALFEASPALAMTCGRLVFTTWPSALSDFV